MPPSGSWVNYRSCKQFLQKYENNGMIKSQILLKINHLKYTFRMHETRLFLLWRSFDAICIAQARPYIVPIIIVPIRHLGAYA